jgi:prophage antirepressor-like protein
MALVASNCDFLNGILTHKSERVPFIYYKDLDEFWMPATPIMKTTGEMNMNHILGRVFKDDRMTFGNIVAVKGLPFEECSGFMKLPNPENYSEKNAWWVNESGFYAMVLGSRKSSVQLISTMSCLRAIMRETVRL